jgi:hypothetical protein
MKTFLVWMLGFSAIFLPKLFVNTRFLDEKEMAAREPGVRTGRFLTFKMIGMACAGTVLLVIGFIISSQLGLDAMPLAGAWFASDAVVEGIFTFQSGVMPLPPIAARRGRSSPCGAAIITWWVTNRLCGVWGCFKLFMQSG